MTKTKHADRFAFLDLETTGLDPRVRNVAEIGCLITDFSLKPVAEPFQKTVRTFAGDWVDPVALEMHVASGLYAESAGEDTWPEGAVGPVRAFVYLSDYLTRNAGDGLIHVGMNPGFDQKFLERFAPHAGLEAINYQVIDVLSIRRMVRSCIGSHALPPIKVPGHRVLSDIQACLEEFRYYISVFKWGAFNPPSSLGG